MLLQHLVLLCCKTKTTANILWVTGEGISVGLNPWVTHRINYFLSFWAGFIFCASAEYINEKKENLQFLSWWFLIFIAINILEPGLPLLKSQFKAQVKHFGYFCNLRDLSRPVSITPKQIEQIGTAEKAKIKEFGPLKYKYFSISSQLWEYIFVSELLNRWFQVCHWVKHSAVKGFLFLFKILWNVLLGLLAVQTAFVASDV